MAGGTAAAGGSASASGSLTGGGAGSGTAYAFGGASGGPGTLGGAATASMIVSAPGASNATALAIGGAGALGGGNAAATASATGSSGTVYSGSATSLSPGNYVFAASAYTSASVDGKSQAKSLAVIGTDNSLFLSSQQGVALVAGAPSSTVSGEALSGNTNMQAVMGVPSSPNFLALAELGGGHSAIGTGVQTTDSVFDFQVALTPQDMTSTLELGLFDGLDTKGVTGVTLDIQFNGTENTYNLGNGAAAASYFKDHPLNLGTLSGPAYAGGVLDFRAELSVTSTSGGFWGGLLISG